MLKYIDHIRFVRSPRKIARTANGYFQTRVLKRNRLRSIELAVTYSCQASCHKCYSANLSAPTENLLTVEEIRDTVQQAKKLGLIHVNLTGGEPTLRKELPDIIRACDPQNITVSLVTNGIKIRKSHMQEMKRAGLDTIQISIDDADPKEHDRLRGVPGCFHQALRVAEWARELNINLVFSCVLSTENTGDNLAKVYDLLELARKEKAYLLLNDGAAVGGWEGQSEKMYDNEDRNKNLFKLLESSHTRHHSMYNFRGEFGCPAGIEKFYISAYGKVTPCNLIHDEFGDVRKQGLKEIWNEMGLHPVYSQKMRDCVRFATGKNSGI